MLTNPAFHDAAGGLLGGTNMAAVHLAKAVGGNVFLGFISAVAFATILAVVAGLTLSGASAVSATISMPRVIKKGKPQRAEIASRRSRLSCWASWRSFSASCSKAERRVHGRPGVRHRGELQLPGAAAFHVLEEADHTWCDDRWLVGSGQSPLA